MSENTENVAMDEFPIDISRAGPLNAQAMAELKFANVMFRFTVGEVELSARQLRRERITTTSVGTLTERLARQTDNDCYLAAYSRRRHEVVGFCRMTWRARLQQYQFRQFYVARKYQRRKIGSRLLEAAKEFARDSNHSPVGIFLYTGEYNKAAQHMYEKMGFVHAGPSESKVEKDGDREIRWLKMVFKF